MQPCSLLAAHQHRPLLAIPWLHVAWRSQCACAQLCLQCGLLGVRVLALLLVCSQVATIVVLHVWCNATVVVGGCEPTVAICILRFHAERLQLVIQMLRVRAVRAPVVCIRVVQPHNVIAPRMLAGINLRESISSSKLQIPGSEPNARYYS